MDISALVAQLSQALKVRESDNPGRDVAKASILVVLEHLRDVGVPANLRTPIMELLAALDDAEAGRSNPLTAPSPKQEGAPKKLARPLIEHGLAVAAVTILIAHGGKKLDEALTFVAPKLGYKKSVLADLRKRYSAPQWERADGKSNISQHELDNFEEWMKDFKSREKADPVAYVRKLIEHARQRRFNIV